MKALTDAGIEREEAERILAARKPEAVPAFELWEENVEAVMIFTSLATQWHRISGLAGAFRTGLMYSEATGYMRERGLARPRRAELLEDLRVMERAALEQWAEDRPSG